MINVRNELTDKNLQMNSFVVAPCMFLQGVIWSRHPKKRSRYNAGEEPVGITAVPLRMNISPFGSRYHVLEC